MLFRCKLVLKLDNKTFYTFLYNRDNGVFNFNHEVLISLKKKV